jgi:hypothetical protein
MEKIKQYTVAETSKPPLTRRQNDTLLSPIPRNLRTLLTTNELMAGAQVEEFLSHLVSSNTNMPFTGTDLGPGLLHQVQLYWDNLMGARRINSAQRARDVKDLSRQILCIPWFTGEITGGHWSLIVRSKSTHGKVAFYHMDSLNRFNNNASYALSNTPLYSQNRDSWLINYSHTNPSAQRATQLRRVLARVYAVSIQNQITTTVP